ncbi:MAG TPA: gamma-glutamyltransferase family protein [Actinomycetota bacterium]|nr:gamma-glutamyltransferase family protein [Actinomycetota bacterium]
MVATSHPLAVSAGLEVLDAGGTAADAAVAAAAALCVVDPRSTGIGGDAFALYWPREELRPVGLAAAGPAPAEMTVGALRDAGYAQMPTHGPWSVTVPGAVAGWWMLLDRYGSLPRDRVLGSAIRHAEEGFAVTPIVAEEWGTAVNKLRRDPYASETFLPEGRSPAAGDRFANPGLARVLRDIVAEGPDAFYRGPTASRIGAAVEAAGGPLRADDLASWQGPEWVDPIRARFGAVEVYELPPPGQGIAVLEALGIYASLAPETPVDREHAAIESIKLAFADARAYVTDPSVHAVPVDRLLSPAFLESRRDLVDMMHAGDAPPGRATDTVFVAAADGEGNACSFIQSLYDGFGSGVGVPETGIVLHNRASGFVMDEDHPNRPEPGKRPYHTIIPAMLGRDDSFLGALGVVGGFQQPQGQLQILRGLFEEGLAPQAALDRPRFRSLGGRLVGFEPSFDQKLVHALADRGHEVSELSRFEAGGAQLILLEDGRYVGASDRRKDGHVGVS